VARLLNGRLGPYLRPKSGDRFFTLNGAQAELYWAEFSLYYAWFLMASTQSQLVLASEYRVGAANAIARFCAKQRTSFRRFYMASLSLRVNMRSMRGLVRQRGHLDRSRRRRLFSRLVVWPSARRGLCACSPDKTIPICFRVAWGFSAR
jgi:hypothetical protein